MAALSNQEAACTLIRAGWPQDLVPTMVAVGRAESGLDPGAVNRDPAVASAPPTGWLQVRAFADRTSKWNLSDPTQNAQAALAVYQAQGLGAWTTYPAASAQFLAGVRQDLAGWDPSKCGAAAAGAGATSTGTGLLAGRQVDPWGIAQGITDSVGFTGSAIGGIGRRIESGGTLLVGLLILGAGVAVVGWLFLTRTDTGRGAVRAGRAAGRATRDAAIALVPK